LRFAFCILRFAFCVLRVFVAFCLSHFASRVFLCKVCNCVRVYVLTDTIYDWSGYATD
jgi:hypothetical protein